MASFRVREVYFTACRTFLGFVLLTGAGLGQNAAELTPGQTPPAQPSQVQPGTLNPDQSAAMQNLPSPPPMRSESSNQLQSPPAVFESHGLEYDAITRNGITVMFAQLPSRLKEFNIIQITV